MRGSRQSRHFREGEKNYEEGKKFLEKGKIFLENKYRKMEKGKIRIP